MRRTALYLALLHTQASGTMKTAPKTTFVTLEHFTVLRCLSNQHL